MVDVLMCTHEPPTHHHPNTAPLPRQYGGQPRLFTNYLETSHNRTVGVFLVFQTSKRFRQYLPTPTTAIFCYQ